MTARSKFLSLSLCSLSDIGWPQQPLTEKVLKFNMSFHDFVKKNFFFKTSKESDISPQIINLEDSEVLSSDFPGLRTSTVSLTSDPLETFRFVHFNIIWLLPLHTASFWNIIQWNPHDDLTEK